MSIPRRKKPILDRRRSILIACGLLAGTVIAGAGSSLGVTLPGHAGAGDPGGDPPPVTLTHAAGLGFGAHLDRTRVLTGSDGTVRMELVMKADPSAEAAEVRVPTDLVVAFDRSSSMAGQKLVDAKAALRELVAQLGERDRFALVSYSSNAWVDIPLRPVTPVARTDWHRTIDRLQADGYTNISHALDVASGLVEGASRAGRQARVILISDGIATAGDTSQVSLVSRARRVARNEYVLTTVGVGNDFNEGLMTALADYGTGNYYYLSAGQALASVFKDELDSARETVATGLAVRVSPRHGVTVLDAAGYPLERLGDDVIFRPGALFAGQERRVWVTLRMPTHEAVELVPASAALTFTRNGARQTLAANELPEVACVQNRQDFFAGLDRDRWASSVIHEEYGQLQEKVAESVRRGQRDKAEKAIHEYRARNERLNAAVGSARVTDNLDAVGDLERQIDEAFSGADQLAKQKKLSKVRSSAAWDGRRAGAKRR